MERPGDDVVSPGLRVLKGKEGFGESLLMKNRRVIREFKATDRLNNSVTIPVGAVLTGIEGQVINDTSLVDFDYNGEPLRRRWFEITLYSEEVTY